MLRTDSWQIQEGVLLLTYLVSPLEDLETEGLVSGLVCNRIFKWREDWGWRLSTTHFPDLCGRLRSIILSGA